MLITILTFLFYVALIAAVIWFVIWVAGRIGMPLPGMAINCLWVAALIFCIILLVKVLGGYQLPQLI